MDKLFYPPEAYDRNLALKPAPLLIAVMLYCALPLLLVVLAYNPSPKLQAAFSPLQHYATPLSLLSGVPAALVIIAWLKRLPESGSFWRRLWHSGRVLLSISLVFHFLLIAYQSHASIWNSYALSTADRMLVVNMGLDLLALYYLWRSPRVADVFADFPARPPSE